MSDEKKAKAKSGGTAAVAPRSEVKKKLKRGSKKELIGKHATHEKDTGSVQVQVALRTDKITMLTEHLKEHPNDDHARRGLMTAVNERRKLLRYLKDRSKEGYEALIGKLGLRH
jgi:small subunit ribosomal protein S15